MRGSRPTCASVSLDDRVECDVEDEEPATEAAGGCRYGPVAVDVVDEAAVELPGP